jgi:hypothetical protein
MNRWSLKGTRLFSPERAGESARPLSPSCSNLARPLLGVARVAEPEDIARGCFPRHASVGLHYRTTDCR